MLFAILRQKQSFFRSLEIPPQDTEAIRHRSPSEDPHGTEQQQHRGDGHALVDQGCRLNGPLDIARN